MDKNLQMILIVAGIICLLCASSSCAVSLKKMLEEQEQEQEQEEQ
jgi:hypothetical protein